jgi:hypothetical protein
MCIKAIVKMLLYKKPFALCHKAANCNNIQS